MNSSGSVVRLWVIVLALFCAMAADAQVLVRIPVWMDRPTGDHASSCPRPSDLSVALAAEGTSAKTPAQELAVVRVDPIHVPLGVAIVDTRSGVSFVEQESAQLAAALAKRFVEDDDVCIAVNAAQRTKPLEIDPITGLEKFDTSGPLLKTVWGKRRKGASGCTEFLDALDHALRVWFGHSEKFGVFGYAQQGIFKAYQELAGIPLDRKVIFVVGAGDDYEDDLKTRVVERLQKAGIVVHVLWMWPYDLRGLASIDEARARQYGVFSPGNEKENFIRHRDRLKSYAHATGGDVVDVETVEAGLQQAERLFGQLRMGCELTVRTDRAGLGALRRQGPTVSLATPTEGEERRAAHPTKPLIRTGKLIVVQER